MEKLFCKKYVNDQVLPDEQDNCSLCGENCIEDEFEKELDEEELQKTMDKCRDENWD